MASGEATETTEGGHEGPLERGITRLVDASELAMEVLEVLTGMVLVFLFAVGLYDLAISIFTSIRSGAVFEIPNVVGFLDTVLLLLIIVEVFRTVVAFTRDQMIVRIIIDASLVAIARKVIGFRPDSYDTPEELFVNASSIAILLLSVIVAFYVVQEILDADASDSSPGIIGTAIGGGDAGSGAGAQPESESQSASSDSREDA